MEVVGAGVSCRATGQSKHVALETPGQMACLGSSWCGLSGGCCPEQVCSVISGALTTCLPPPHAKRTFPEGNPGWGRALRTSQSWRPSRARTLDPGSRGQQPQRAGEMGGNVLPERHLTGLLVDLSPNVCPQAPDKLLAEMEGVSSVAVGPGRGLVPVFSACADTGGRGSRTAAATGSRAGGCHKQMSSVLRLPKKKPQRAAASSRMNRSGSVASGSGKSRCSWGGGWGSPFERQGTSPSLVQPEGPRGSGSPVRCSVHRTYLWLNRHTLFGERRLWGVEAEDTSHHQIPPPAPRTDAGLPWRAPQVPLPPSSPCDMLSSWLTGSMPASGLTPGHAS